MTIRCYLQSVVSSTKTRFLSISFTIKLNDFFGLLGRLVNVDTRFETNPELQIFHRVQQLVEIVRRTGGVITYMPVNLPSMGTWPSNGQYPEVNFSSLKANDFGKSILMFDLSFGEDQYSDQKKYTDSIYRNIYHAE